MNRYLPGVLVLTALVVLQPIAAQAYIGPGVGAGAISAVLGVLGSIFLAIVAVVYYPIKRLLKRGKRDKTPGKPAE
jgi:hypothetical protein